ncbi:MAG: hypothetical protein ACTSRI_20440 [Promethearchaeota archaeon]
MIDYLDEDVAYLLGMLVARGTISEHRGHYTIAIEIPYSYIQIDDPPWNSEGDRNALLVSVDVIINRLSELTTNTPNKRPGENSVSIVFEISRRTLFVRDLQMLLDNKRDYTEFSIPEEIFKSPINMKKEFMRGFADVNGKVRKSNAYFRGEHRIYIDILNNNWKLPIQLCDLLQHHLNIPIQTLTWGHPNLRNKPEEKWTKREHQIKIFNNDFEEIGFYIKHKNKKSLEFAKENEEKAVSGKMCDPLIKMQRKITINPFHPDESNIDLPEELKGKHYDSFWQICRDLGCNEFNKQHSIDNFIEED